jgi:hypothetical protein
MEITGTFHPENSIADADFGLLVQSGPRISAKLDAGLAPIGCRIVNLVACEWGCFKSGPSVNGWMDKHGWKKGLSGVYLINEKKECL